MEDPTAAATPVVPGQGHDATRAARLLWLPLLGAALGTRAFGLPVPLADFALLALCGLAPLALGRRLVPALPSWWPALAVFVGAALLSGVPPLWGHSPFSGWQFLRSAAKLLLYAASALLVHALARLAGSRAAATRVLQAFALSGALGLALYGALQAGLPLPVGLACGDHTATCSALYYERRWFGDSSPAGLQHDVYPRAQGLASEPTRFGYLQAMALGLLVLGGTTPLDRGRGGLLLVAASALLSFALAPWALLLATALLALPRLRETRGVVRTAGLTALLVALLLALPPVRASFEHAVLGRLQRLAAGQLDSSAALRVVGSWSLARRLAAERPLTGVGLGNFDVAVAAWRDQLPERVFLEGEIQGWNALAHVLGTTGLLGAAAFLALLAVALRRSPPRLALFALSLFADGAVLSAPFWVFLALYALPPPVDSSSQAR